MKKKFLNLMTFFYVRLEYMYFRYASILGVPVLPKVLVEGTHLYLLYLSVPVVAVFIPVTEGRFLVVF